MLEPLPETMLDEDKASPTPDLILYDNQTEQTPIIVEVCRTPKLKQDQQKVAFLIDDASFGICEGFVYDYKLRQWHQYRLGIGWLTESESFSDVLGLDLDAFLR